MKKYVYDVAAINPMMKPSVVKKMIDENLEDGWCVVSLSDHFILFKKRLIPRKEETKIL